MKTSWNRIIFNTLKWTLIIGIVFFSISLVTKPIRKDWSDNYIDRGDSYLAQKKYLTAILEYRKSEILYKNKIAPAKIDFSNKAMADVMTMEKFYQEKNIESEIAALSLANNTNLNKFEIVKNSRQLIENGEFQAAIIPAKNATEIDKMYRDAWLYLGIANLKTAENVEMYKKSRSQYLAEANNALVVASKLDPAYQPTKDYIAELKKLK